MSRREFFTPAHKRAPPAYFVDEGCVFTVASAEVENLWIIGHGLWVVLFCFVLIVVLWFLFFRGVGERPYIHVQSVNTFCQLFLPHLADSYPLSFHFHHPVPRHLLPGLWTGAFWLVSLLASSSPAIFQAQRSEWSFPNVSFFSSVPCTGPCNGFASSWNKSQKPSIWLPAAFWDLPCPPHSLPSITDLSGSPCSCQAYPPRPSLPLTWNSLIPNICRAYPSTPFLFLLRKTFPVSFSLLFLLP